MYCVGDADLKSASNGGGIGKNANKLLDRLPLMNSLCMMIPPASIGSLSQTREEMGHCLIGLKKNKRKKEEEGS